ncbi:MAG: DUF1330 domain-containing protein [Smithellaceae bacterium]|jgi:uncharacterized protein (DUF1330 family)|nr:DUF1330 domain-containing protein [Syntrophaceae bacterium]MDX9816168.1 DUF1330 domain-containing protein [Smithellaceae bacterium]NMD04306.1 DUF1330 domain-containing protein [Deltaproteobacteria bacterium]MBP8609212.1 DUF1330 domain-containing protein [Syntrophaceae bacterium]HNQ18490.1 DUF1330 domain-containing protein [Smithellaceae bacterium]
MDGVKMNTEQLEEFIHNPNNEPFVMLNLLKFKKEGGKESYARYLKEANKYAEDVGAKVIFLSRPKELLNGSEEWDVLMLIRYPSRKAFLTMANNHEYLKVHRFREEALERAVLYATDEITLREILPKKE